MLTMLIQATFDFAMIVGVIIAIPYIILAKSQPWPPKASATDFTDAV